MGSFVEADSPRLVARLSDLRVRFATTLMGRWFTAQGSFDVVMSEEWDFRPDGTLIVTFSPRPGDQETYRWESVGPFQVRLGLPPCDEDPDGTWTTVAYAFAVFEHDAGREVVLHEVGTDGFWLTDAPLRVAQ